MNNACLTALIRTHPGREQQTERAIKSAENNGCAMILFNGQKVEDFSYNLYCNELKSQVEDGYFFFLDSDDFVIDGAIDLIRPKLKEACANIVQMLRNGRPKPAANTIKRGHIGMPCLVLHASHKDVADVTAKEIGDYEWISSVANKLPINFIPIPLVNAGSRSHGR